MTPVSKPPKPHGPVATLEIPILSFETDYVGIVNNTEFLRFLERVRYVLARKVGFTFKNVRKLKLWTVLARAEVDFRSPARFEDVLVARGWVERVGKTSLTLAYDFHVKGRRRLVAQGRQIMVFIDPKFRPAPVPAALRRRLGA
jgi:YbgC/YbaW family acyl-CoA thioester hydrolase